MLVVVAAALALTTSATALMALAATMTAASLASVAATVLVVATATTLTVLTLLVAAILVLATLGVVVVHLSVLLRHHPLGARLRLRHTALVAWLHVVAPSAVSPKFMVKNTL